MEDKLKPKLYAVLLGGRPPGATIEQHNMFFGIGNCLEDLYKPIKKFWRSAPQVHIDAYMCLEEIGDYDVVIQNKSDTYDKNDFVSEQLFFINLGGYRTGIFAEDHKNLFVVAKNEGEAKAVARKDSFFRDVIFEERSKEAVTHIDDKLCLDNFDHYPLGINNLIDVKRYRVLLKKVRSGSDLYPKVVAGYHKIP